MKNRIIDDRREKQVNIDKDNRKSFRRQEDINNLKAYYLMLVIIGGLLITVGVTSYIFSV